VLMNPAQPFELPLASGARTNSNGTRGQALPAFWKVLQRLERKLADYSQLRAPPV
jgi:hypothetical protein